MQEDSLLVEGKLLISVKRAAEKTGYTRDYIGQLARGGKVLARRVERAWFVEEQSLLEYKKYADEYTPIPPAPEKKEPLESIVSFDGKEYISAQRAAEICGYNPDYVSQMARTGTIESRRIGGRWFVSKDKIVSHKKYNDSLLAAVQASSVGLQIPTGATEQAKERSVYIPMRYDSDKSADLIPKIMKMGTPAASLGRSFEPRTSIFGAMDVKKVDSENKQSARRVLRNSPVVLYQSKLPVVVAGAVTGVMAATLFILTALGPVSVKGMLAAVVHSVEIGLSNEVLYVRKSF